MQVQDATLSDEDLSKYKKRGYEYVEEEKVALDELVALYRKRLEIDRQYLNTLEELHSTATASFDAANPLYTRLVQPVLDNLQKDIEGYRQYARHTEYDLSMITFPIGPRSVVQNIQQDTEAVMPDFLEYSASCVAVSKLPFRVLLGGYKLLYEEDIKHRQIVAKLHSMQKVARTHFETTYPKLLDDHMECMEQVRKLVLFNATRRSELSTTIACNSSAEKECVDKFSTTDAIAVPHLKMGLEMCQREYHHAPVLNVLTRELDEGCTVILGREIVSGATENLAQDVIIACLKRCTRVSAVSVESRWKLRLENYWDIIHRMELNPSAQNISYLVATLDKVEAMELIRTIMSNTGARHPILNIVDLESMQKLQTDCWDRSALARVMKDVNPDVRTILNACATAYITTKEKHVANLILQTRFGDLSLIDLKWLSLDAIFSMWDCDEWKPLPKDVEWRRQYQCSPGSTPFMSRMRRFPAVAGYNDGWVYIDVDTDGAISDTQWNQSRRTWIKWVGEEGDGPVSKSRIGSILRKFNI